MGFSATARFVATTALSAYLFYARALVSGWWFFAAILSVVIYGHLRYRDLRVVPRPMTRGVVPG